jgi:hypothetical protein
LGVKKSSVRNQPPMSTLVGPGFQSSMESTCGGSVCTSASLITTRIGTGGAGSTVPGEPPTGRWDASSRLRPKDPTRRFHPGHERKAEAVGDRIPGVVVGELEDLLAGGIIEPERFAVAVQGTGELAGDVGQGRQSAP